MRTQTDVIDSLPAHLRPFVAVQNYADYTPRDQAIWRFLLQQLSYSLRDTAHPTYFEGLEKTGIGFEAIPKIETINACLSALGWRAVAVDGFLPPAIFMEFQAQRVLAIAVNIRSFEHMLYTPAPDIIHESAGHSPFLVDIDYAEFLQRFGELGMQAIANQHDADIYAAVRQLSITKEDPAASEEELKTTQQQLEDLQRKTVEPSEANLLARLHWWTVEYGLVGDTDSYHIFGAGLLSSLAESQSCIDDQAVVKTPLSVNVIRTSYDITIPQPQLYVTESCRHLSQVLEEYGRHMCCQRGGSSALEEAQQSGNINTVTYNSGLQVSGKLAEVITDAVGNAIYWRSEGPTQLAFQDKQLNGHGIDFHSNGFSSPIGRLRTMERCLSAYTIDELKRHKIEIGQFVRLNFLSGITVTGTLTNILRREQHNILFTFEDCTVKDIDDKVLFDPAWGIYDMAVGDTITSVAGGSADKLAYPLHQAPAQTVTAAKQYSDNMHEQFKLYAALRECRETKAAATDLIGTIIKQDQLDWLLYFEALELVVADQLGPKIQTELISKINHHTGDTQVLITQGMERLGLQTITN